MISSRRVDIKTFLSDVDRCRRLIVDGIIGDQLREGIITTREQADYAYDQAIKWINKETK